MSALHARHVFLDLETTGLEAGVDEITEMAWILDDGSERQFIVEHDRLPHPWVFEKSDYRARIAPAPKTPLVDVLEVFTADCMDLGERDATVVYLVGACPAFDDRFLRRAFSTAYPLPHDVPYNYHVIDIEAMAMGALGHDAPCTLRELRGALGIEGENPAPYTALGDAREVRLIWEALRVRAGTIRAVSA